MKNDDIYSLVSRLNDEENLILTKEGSKIGPVSFLTLQEAKDHFKRHYQVLTDLPPTNMSLYASYFEQIAVTYPFIVKLNRTDAIQPIAKWRKDNDVINYETPFFTDNTFFMRMKLGFIDRFKVLDVVKDIESIPCIGPDGNIIINKIVITRNGKGDGAPRAPFTEKDADELLRQRGFL